PRRVEGGRPRGTREGEGDADLLPATEAGRPAAPAADIARAAETLLAAKNPIIYAGGGANLSGAHEALRAVAEHLQAAVASSPEGKGAVGDLSDLSLGAAFWPASPLRAALQAADVVLVVGSRLALVSFAPAQQIL